MITLRSTVVVASLSILAANGSASPQGAVRQDQEAVPLPWLRFELPARKARLSSGEEVDFFPHEIWRPVCSSDARRVTLDQLGLMVAAHKTLAQGPRIVIDHQSATAAGLNVFVASGSPAGAPAALAASEAYVESLFTDPITVTINVSFQVLNPGVLGGTSSSSGYLTYTATRSQLVADKNANDPADMLLDSLPAGSTCPVRYTSSSSVTNENRCFFNFATYKATGGSISGADANMTFNSSFAFDYDPSNGVGGSSYSFQDIVIHETGHALGFTSGGDFRNRDMDVLDLFRFRMTDGSGDFNPDTTAEFQGRARQVSYNTPNDDHNSDLISAEYRMSDGSPYQMSHFREQAANIGLMDPALAATETHYPSFFSTADLAMFDIIGYDR